MHGTQGHEISPQAETPPTIRRWAALVPLCLAQFRLIVDITVVQVALPSVGAVGKAAPQGLLVGGVLIAFGIGLLTRGSARGGARDS